MANGFDIIYRSQLAAGKSATLLAPVDLYPVELPQGSLLQVPDAAMTAS